VQFAGFLQCSLWFSVFVNNDGGFSNFLPNAFYGFSGFAKEVTSLQSMVGHSFQNYDRVYAGFSAMYTSLHMLRMGFKLIYTTISIAYIRIFKGPHICVNSSAGICEINAQIYASYKDPYIRVLKWAYI